MTIEERFGATKMRIVLNPESFRGRFGTFADKLRAGKIEEIVVVRKGVPLCSVIPYRHRLPEVEA